MHTVVHSTRSSGCFLPCISILLEFHGPSWGEDQQQEERCFSSGPKARCL